MPTQQTAVSPRETKGFTLVELPAVSRRETKGFTLVELMVVMLIIVLAAALTLPSIMKIFSAGADVMAFNLLSAQLESARTLAIENGKGAAVHMEMADASVDGNSRLKGIQYGCVVTPTAGLFGKAPGFQPMEYPGNIAFGEADRFQNANVWAQITDAQLFDTTNKYGDFTTCTIVYNPDGQAVVRYENGLITFNPDDGLFSGDNRLWAVPAAEEGVLAVTLFSYPEVEVLTPLQRQTYLNAGGQYLMVNHYTGLLYERE